MFKKLFAVGTTSALTLAMAVSAFAAGSINAEEQKILDELTAKGVPASYVAQVKEALEADGTDVTADDAKAAIANIDAAKKLVDEKGIKTIDELKANKEAFDEVKKLVNASAELKSVDVTVSFDATTGKPSIVAKSDDAKKDDELKKLGADFSTTAAVVAGLGLSVAGIAVVAKKKDLVNA